MKVQAAFVKFAAFVIFVGWAGGVWGADHSDCFSCHQDEALEKLDPSGRKVSLYVPEAEYRRSVHGKLSCSDCHQGIRDDAHAAGEGPMMDRVNCGVCHGKAEREYRQSLHAQAILKGTTMVPGPSTFMRPF